MTALDVALRILIHNNRKKSIIDEVSSSLVYMGFADETASESDEKWTIARVVKFGSIYKVNYANGFSSTNAWNQRVSYFSQVELDNTVSTFFDGINDYVSLGDNFNFDRSIQFSYSFWMNANNFSGTRYFMSKVSNDVSTVGWRIGHDSTGKIILQVRTTLQGFAPLTCQTALSAMTYYHVCLTYNGGSNMNGFKIYINAVQDSSFGSQVLAYTWVNNNIFEIGCSKNATHFPGHIDEVSFWDKELSGSEVSEIYNAGAPGNLADHSAFANLLSWYRMGDGDTHPTIVDAKGSINGTMNNMSASSFVGVVP